MSLTSLLPAPRAVVTLKVDDADDNQAQQQSNALAASLRAQIPPYGQRKGWIPKSLVDFSDGGAFPEIHVAQFPLDMGRKKASATGSGISSVRNGQTNGGTVPLTTDSTGKLRYDAVIRKGGQSGMQTAFKDMVPIDIKPDDPSWERPDEETVKATTDRTRAALEKVLASRVTAGQPRGESEKEETKGPSYVKYTSTQGAVSNTRIIRMVEAQVDPLEPPRFKVKKMPRTGGSPPPPVMHSPPRKVSAEEQKAWYIPPTISNWKNAKGYTIPLDKRLAADGRGLQEIAINDGFAKLSEALFIADRHAREEVRIRAEMQQRLAEKEKREKEEKLRTLAQQARDSRTGLTNNSTTEGTSSNAVPLGTRRDSSSIARDSPSQSPVSPRGGRGRHEDDEEDDEEARRTAKERDQLRREQQKKREREMRMTHMGADTKARVLSKSEDRDISEKIALGLAKPSMSKETMFDSRLFNQSEGLSSGFGADDSYGIYDKPLFQGGSASAIYRPKKMDSEVVPGVDTERIDRILEGGAAPHRGFKGTEGGLTAGSSRDGPVQFEKEEPDMFGIESFLTSAKRGREKDLGARSGGSMLAAVAGKKEDYEGNTGAKRKMQFEQAGSSNWEKRGRY
ncbi:hypothetical protein SeMB42_g02691 [Synchytrium endobioticum]|uniref:Pre-mRNA-processing protein 45 n=1 Tax=Synchytrium endobioticum TaxID=286115 RepID=A0A507D6C9_9FUNG|nr:hypothetical protein SeLEV6574_g02980 [Synchytrium endobioticum]TPX49231.1 hypothetical protein SeMB42_g02691 [Synchytrium endobioticum]